MQKRRSTRVFGRGRALRSVARASSSEPVSLKEIGETKNLAALEDEQERREAAEINERIAKLKSGELKPLSDADAAKWREQAVLNEGEHMKRWNEAGEAERRAQEAQKKYGKKNFLTEAKRKELVESYQALGLSEEEARLATSIHRAVVEDDHQRLVDVGKALGLSEVEAQAFASKRR